MLIIPRTLYILMVLSVPGREGVIMVEQYEAKYCKVCGAGFKLPTSEGRAPEASKDAEAVANTKVEVR
jgi:hypothetical protein